MEVTTKDNDFSEEDVERINTFVANGCQGLESLVKNEHKINSLFSLYMTGKTYTEISKITRVKKDLVLYMSAKMTWYNNRMEYLTDIQKEMTTKLKNTRVESLNFINSLISVHHKYYNDALNDYITTGDKTIFEDLDLKQLSQYFKSIEILEKMMNPTNVTRGGGSGTTVNINTPGGEVKQIDDNTLEITPGKAGDILKALAAHKDEKKKEDL